MNLFQGIYAFVHYDKRSNRFNNIRYSVMHMQKQQGPNQIQLKEIKEAKQLDLQIVPFKCILGEDAIFVCASPSCQCYAFVCKSSSCKCHTLHQNCILIQPNRLNQKIQKKMINSQGIVTHINKIVDQCIDWLSEFRQKMQFDLKYYGLTLIEKQYIQAIHDRNLDFVTGKIVFPVLQSVNAQNQIIKVQQAIQLITSCWQKDTKLFQSIFQSLEKLVSSGDSDSQFLVMESKIVTSNNQFKALTNMFNKKIKKFRLLYRASENNFEVKKFYEKCSNIPNTVVLVHTNYDKKIGGYTPVEWRVGMAEQNFEDASGKSFIFSLTNGDKFNLIEPDKAIQYYGEGCGPRFGGTSGASDLTIKDHANDNTESYALFNNCYYNEKYKKSDTESYRNFAGGDTNFFKVKEWQVYQVDFM